MVKLWVEPHIQTQRREDRKKKEEHVHGGNNMICRRIDERQREESWKRQRRALLFGFSRSQSWELWFVMYKSRTTIVVKLEGRSERNSDMTGNLHVGI